MKGENYIPCREIASRLDLASGGILWLAADLIRLAWVTSRREGDFDVRRFIAGFMDQLGQEGTLVISSFNHNLENKSHYSRSRTIPVTGALASEAMKMDQFTRTRNPLHSFLAWGRHAGSLAGLNNRSSFGSDSPFAFLHDYQAKMVIIGTSLSNAFTFVHYVEELNKVRYRKYKKYRIFLQDEGQWQDYLLYAKKTGWTMDMSGLESLLLESGAAGRREINGIPCFIVDLAASFPLIREDIVKNRAGNIARFSLKCCIRDSAKSILRTAGLRTKSDQIRHDPGLL